MGLSASQDKKAQQELEGVFADWTRVTQTPAEPDQAKLDAAVAKGQTPETKIQEYLLGRTKPDSSLRYR
jgi:hypothetical protein